MMQEALLSPQSRQVAALLFFCGPLLRCDLFGLYSCIDRARPDHPVLNGLVFSIDQVRQAIAEMEKMRFLTQESAKGSIIINRTRPYSPLLNVNDIYDDFVAEIWRLDGFDENRRLLWRAASAIMHSLRSKR